MKRAKYRWAFIAAVIVVIIIVFLIYSMSGKQSVEPLKILDLSLQETVAVALYSSSVPYETDGNGKSVLIFIDKDGEINALERKGLELNSIIAAKDKLILHEKDSILTIHSEHDVLVEPMPQCKVISGYGQSSGLLEKKGLYYSVFNHMFMTSETKYLSYIRWGNGESEHCEEIYEYIETTGHDEEKVYLISTDTLDQGRVSLIEIEIEGDSIKESHYLLAENVYDRLYFTNIVSDGQNLYYIVADILESIVQLKLVQIDKSTKQIQNVYFLHEYSLNEGTKYFFFNRDSIYIHDGKIYYVDGYGDVYAVDLIKKDEQHLFRFVDYERKDYLNDEQVFFNEDGVHFFHYDDSQQVHLIEKYNFNGEKLEQIQINFIKNMIREKGIFIYDFKMVN